MNTTSSLSSNWLKKSSVFLLFFIVESMAFSIITLSLYFSTTVLFGFHTVLTVALFLVTLFLIGLTQN